MPFIRSQHSLMGESALCRALEASLVEKDVVSSDLYIGNALDAFFLKNLWVSLVELMIFDQAVKNIPHTQKAPVFILMKFE